MLFVIHMIDHPDSAPLRDATTAKHQEFVGKHVGDMFMGGPLLSDDGKAKIGSLMVMDFPDRAAAAAFIAEEPYNRAGLFESVSIRAFHAVVPPGDREVAGATSP